MKIKLRKVYKTRVLSYFSINRKHQRINFAELSLAKLLVKNSFVGCKSPVNGYLPE